METWEALAMSRKEVVRPGLVKALVAGQLTNRQVATALRLSIRQVQRLKRRFEAAGAAGLVHRTRGRPSPRRLAPTLRQRVMDLLQTVYTGMDDCNIHEEVLEAPGIVPPTPPGPLTTRQPPAPRAPPPASPASAGPRRESRAARRQSGRLAGARAASPDATWRDR